MSSNGFKSSNVELLSSKETVWDDEVTDLKPPSIEQNESASNYSYNLAVSEISSKPDNTEDQTSIKEVLELQFSDDEEIENAGIKATLDELSSGEVIPVRISDVNNPMKFWVHVRREKNRKEIERLYKEME